MVDFSKKRYVSDKKILKIIKEEIDRLLINEEYSVSDTVMECASEITSAVEMAYNSDSYHSCVPVNILMRKDDGSYVPGETVIKEFYLQLSENIKKKIPKLVMVTVFVIEFADVDTYRVNYENIDIGGSYSLYGHTITINTIALGGKIRSRMLYQNLLHEVEHAYQYSLANQTDYKHLLGIANKHLSDGNPIISSTANLLYYFNPREIDANIQSFYDDLNYVGPKDIGSIEQTELISERNSYIDRYYNHLRSFPNDEISKVIKPVFHIDAEFLYSYIDRQIKYLNKKIMRVYHLYVEKNKEKDVKLNTENKTFYIR